MSDSPTLKTHNVFLEFKDIGSFGPHRVYQSGEVVIEMPADCMEVIVGRNLFPVTLIADGEDDKADDILISVQTAADKRGAIREWVPVADLVWIKKKLAP